VISTKIKIVLCKVDFISVRTKRLHTSNDHFRSRLM